MVLRQQVKEYYLLGNYALAEKYCKILSRSTAHGKFVAAYRKLMADGTPRTPDPPETSARMPLIGRNPLHNLLRLSVDSPSDFTVDRLLCTFLLQRDLDRFAATFKTVAASPRFAAGIPVIYQKAMLLYYDEANVPMGERVNYFSPHTMGAYRRFCEGFLAGEPMSAQQEKYGNTYWFYYQYAR